MRGRIKKLGLGRHQAMAEGDAGGKRGTDEFEGPRERLIKEIETEFRLVGNETGEPVLDPLVADALRNAPRHLFVPPVQRDYAYYNTPLPIGHGQTISQPFIVAIMTQLLHLAPGAKVLEVGTGSGYQAAVLAELTENVFTIETVPELAESARQRLQGLGYGSIQVRYGDGSLGWPEEAPFDAIIVTAGGARVPLPLIEQLKPGGRLVIPVGGFGLQMLKVIEKEADGGTTEKEILPVAFVPLVTGKRFEPKWEHFEHGADIGVRGIGGTLHQAFELAAMALTAIVTKPEWIGLVDRVEIRCQASDREILLADWLNAVICEMASRNMLFGVYTVRIEGETLFGTAVGETVDQMRHKPAVEPKGATLTSLYVGQREDGAWVAQCIVDV